MAGLREEREIDMLLSEDVKIRLRRNGRPIEEYAVLLLVRDYGQWREARVFDNHGGTHHMHRFTRGGGKQRPEKFHSGSINEAIPAAIAHLKQHWPAIIFSWRRS